MAPNFLRPLFVLAMVLLAVECQANQPGGPSPYDLDRMRLRDTLQPTRLVLVETETFDEHDATIRTFEREVGGKSWEEVGQAVPAVVGRNGIGWGYQLEHLGKRGDPLKKEGDGKTPAGRFMLGRPFLLHPTGDPEEDGYMALTGNRLFCIDDAGSEQYNWIVPADSVPTGTSGERMWEINLYKRGIVVDYPTKREAKSGSCIFVHIWETPETPTSGCVAASEDTVKWLQGWAANAERGVWIAILPKSERWKLGLHLPE